MNAIQDQYGINASLDQADQQGNDRITQILQSRAATMPSNQPPALPQQMPQSIPQQQQIRPLDIIKQAASSGNPQAQALYSSASMFSNDPDHQDALVQGVIDHPNEIDPSNKYQVMTTMSQISKQSGINSQVINGQQSDMQIPAAALQMPNNQQISMQDLGNISSGKGTNFLGLQQGAAQDIANLQFRQAQENRFNAIAANGGSGGAGLAAAHQMMNEWNTNHPDKPMTLQEAYMMATAKQGQGVTVDPTTGKYITAAGAPESSGAMEAAKEGGKLGEDLAYAGPIAKAKEFGTKTGEQDQADQMTIRNAQLTGKIYTRLGQTASSVPSGVPANKLADASNWAGDPTQGAINKAAYEANINNLYMQMIRSLKGTGRVMQSELDQMAKAAPRAEDSVPVKVSKVNSHIDYYNDTMDALGYAGNKIQHVPMPGQQQTSPTGKPGGILHQDAKGNKAVVYPDGSYDEVQ